MENEKKSQIDDKKEFDRIISESQVESDLLEKEIKNLGKSAKAFAERHGDEKNG